MKRFTATEKWTDPWFRKLSPSYKLAWAYLCENCDAAGVIDLDREMADFKIGETIDWDGFLKVAGNRCEVISRGKIWLTGFIEFQYVRLSEDCKAHKPVYASIEKHALHERVFKGYPKATNGSHKDKEKDKDKDKELEGGAGETKPARFVPPTVAQVRDYCRERSNAVDPESFVDFYKSKGWRVGDQAMRDWKAAVRTWEKNNTARGSPRPAMKTGASHLFDPNHETRHEI